MRKIVMVALVTGGFLGVQGQPAKRRIAIYDFDYSSVKSEVRKTLGADSDVGHNVAEMLLSPLTESGVYEVMDRARVETLMKEQNLKFSSRFDSSQAVAYGKILQVDAIVTGTVNNLSVEQIQKTKGVLGIGHKKIDVKATVELTAQMISTETGQIYLAPSSIAEVTEEVGSESGDTASGTGGGTRTTGNVEAQVVRKAIHQALNDISKDMIRKASGLPTRMQTGKPSRPPTDVASVDTSSVAGVRSAAPPVVSNRKPITGMVMDVSGGSVFIDKGRTAGVLQGDSFEVRHYLKTVTNSAGKAIKLDQKIGVLKITEVNDDWASGTYTGETPPQKNDAVRLQ
jgi:curli biogenesis system outer membrane secretion channel CsgG